MIAAQACACLRQKSTGEPLMFDVSWKQFVKDLYEEIQNDNVFNGAAALAYYLMLAIFPAAIFLLTLLPYLPIPNLQQAIMDLLAQAMPGEASNLFAGVVQSITSEKRGGLLSFGLLFTLWSASNGLYAIMQQLNITYNVKEGRPFWKVRGTAVMLMLMFLLLIIGAFGLVVFGGMIQDWIASVLGSSQILLTIFALFRWMVIVLLLLMGFAITYYFGPDVEQKFRFITPGSITGVIILIAASLAFKLYIANFANYSATYGSLGAVIILMLWLYITGLAILIGSEVNALIEHHQPQGKEKGEKEEPRSQSRSYSRS
jgi:membrane protein